MRSILTLFVLFFFMQVSFSQDQSFNELWKQVEDYELEGLPKSAMTVLEVIRAKAEAEGDIPQEIKVLLFKSKFALSLEEDAQLKIINDFKTELEGNEYPVSNFIHSIIGNLYWKYFLNNRWRFYNRTNTQAKVDKNDFRTWDLRTIFDEVAFHYEESLKNGLQLQIDKIDKFDLLVINAPNSRVYRPSLYDFLAHRALDFFKTNETSITKPRYKFEIDSPDFIEDAVTFSQLNIQTPDSTSLQLKALLIYQDLTRFHLKDSTPEALVDLNIKRLSYVREHASFPDVDDLFLQTLQAEKEKYPGQEVSGLYDFEIARLLVEKGKTFDPEKNPDVRWKLKEAHEICAKVLSQFEESPAARNCQILMEEIEKKTISIRAEHLIPNNKKSRLLVSYSNHDQLDLKILPLSRDQFLSLQNQYRAEDQFEFFQKLDMLHTWETNLRNEGDFQSHRSEIVLPELANGLYVVLAMPDPKDNSLFAFTTVQTTNLALTQKRGKTWDIFQIIDRNNGKPIKDVTVTASFTSHRDKSYSVTKTTNNKGEFQVKSTSRYYSVSFKAQKSGETAFYDDYYIRSNGRRDRPKTLSRAFIFSDRSIYRPGQPIYFKAIMLKNDGVSTAVISDEKYMVELRDVNNTEIASMELQSNDFGSIHGSFVLPEGGLTGQYRLKFSSQTGKQEINQSHYISVEEYKRPKFFVEFEPMKESIRLNDSVKVKGEALAYSGPSVTDAKVVYRVSRQVNFPRWFYWYKPWYNSEPQEIAYGETTTDKSGQFEIDFIALPDKSVDRESQPIFNYEIQADITDINGETRSKTMVVRVGYHSILATLNLPDKLDKKKKDYQISIDTKNLNDEFYPTSGMVKILKLKSPGRVLRPRIWSAPDYQVIEKDDFISQFPNEAFQNEHDKNNWERGEVVFESDFDTEQSKTLDLGNIRRWKSGIYVVELEATDAFGETVKDQVKTTVYSDSDDGPADDQLFVLSTDKTEYKPGDKARVNVESAAHTWVTVDIEKDHKLIRTEILELNNNSKHIEIPVEKEDLGGFAVLISLAAFNSYQTESLVLNVPYPSTELEIETNTFRDKLKPGLEETWSFTVKGPEGEKVAAEMLAGMYDASLDQFKSHDWYFNPFPKSNYYSIGIRNGSRSFGTRDFRLSRRDFGRRSYHSQGYDHLNWFGLDLFNPGAYDQYLFKLRRSRNLSKTGNISGLVNDSSGPLPGVNVMIKGSNTGTQTDFDGMYWIDANPGETLVFSYVGYMTKELVVGKSNSIDVFMDEDAAQLEEMVVTGVGRRGAKATPMTVEENEMFMAADVSESEADSMGAGIANAENGIEDSAETGFEGIALRTNFQETAFFFPVLRTDNEGNVSFEFAVPEALTEWKLQLLSHSKKGFHATKSMKTVTQKDLMVLPNPPRFLREGDNIIISTKIANLTDESITGKAALQLFDAISETAVDQAFSNKDAIKDFEIDANGNTQVSWQLLIPDTTQALQYRIVAKCEDISDGEQNVLPVLSNRMLVTETLPMWVGSDQTKSFNLKKLRESQSETLNHHNLTLEVTSNPAWYAVQALPYLMEYPHECSEQIFARLYANVLATHLANSNPKIRNVFDAWKNSGALISNLEKNPELKSLLIQETPWLRDAQSEAEQKKRIGLLFDLNKMRSETQSSLRKLKRQQYPSGAWPWFDGGPESRYITQHIIAGMGHLKQLGIEVDGSEEMIKSALNYLDRDFVRSYEEITKYKKDVDLEKDHLNYIQLHYLYMRSFYPEFSASKEVMEIQNYYLGQIDKYWLDRNLYSKGLMALASFRNERSDTATKIIKSLKEFSMESEELGMYWKENTSSWFWYQAPIETQALMIELFTEMGEDIATIDKLKVWLLKNKQTNSWSTTKSTTAAVYALMQRGSDWLSVTDAVEVIVGQEQVDPKSIDGVDIEAGTGYFKTSWKGTEITSDKGEVTLTKTGDGIAWAGLYWQYFEDLDKITSAETPLKLKKKLFLKKNTDLGESLTEIVEGTAIEIGDLVRVRIELRVDRPMEFVHMKDMRASGFEPINVLSSYKWQDGLGYYESTKDASTNFFIDRLPKGVYVFEYDLRANNAGDFSNGITSIQSMYAPEFSSHSEGIRVKIK